MFRSWILALLLMIEPLILLLHVLCKLSNGLDPDDLALEWFRLIDSALWAHLRPWFYFGASLLMICEARNASHGVDDGLNVSDRLICLCGPTC